MRNIGMIALGLAGALGTTANAQSFVGAWTATSHLDGGVETSEKLKVTRAKDGYSIIGKAIGAPPGAPEAGPGTDIVIEGDAFSYTRVVKIGNNDIAIVYKGNVSGDRFTGTAELGGSKVPYTGVRAPAGE